MKDIAYLEVTSFLHMKLYDRLLAKFGWMHLKLNFRLALRITRIYKKGQLSLRLEFRSEC